MYLEKELFFIWEMFCLLEIYSVLKASKSPILHTNVIVYIPYAAYIIFFNMLSYVSVDYHELNKAGPLKVR